MKKKLIAAAVLFMTANMANAATLDNTSSVTGDFEGVGGCTVSGTWTGEQVPAAVYQGSAKRVGVLGISLSGCTSQVYFEGNDKNSEGLPQATDPKGNKIVIVPSFDALNNLVSKDSTLNVFYSKNSLNDGDTLSVELVNRDQWNAKAGKHTMTLNVGTYSI